MTVQTDEELAVVHVATAAVRDDGRKGYYGPDVELLLMSDGSVQWRYESDDA